MALDKSYGIAMGWPLGPGQLPPPVGVPVKALTFSDNTPLQFADGSYLELSA